MLLKITWRYKSENDLVGTIFLNVQIFKKLTLRKSKWNWISNLKQ